nr:alpha-mannosidase [Bacillota bacterium]
IEKLISEIKSRVKEPVLDLMPIKYIECGYKKDNCLPIVDDTWHNLKKGDRFGGYDKHFLLYTKFTTPECKEGCELRFTLETSYHNEFTSILNPQCILYKNGKIVQGLDLNHTEYDLSPNEEYEIYIYLYTGLYDAFYSMNVGVVSVNKQIEMLYYDMKVPYDAANCFEDDSFESREILKHLEIAENLLDLNEEGQSEAFVRSAKSACDYMSENFYGKYSGAQGIIDCIGHTHIDVAWLWTYAQTREKVQRSFSTVLSLMKKYSNYTFMTSQPQLLEYLKEEAPDVYAEFKEYVKQGRIEVEGAMWVEPDCNLSSGESLVRQLIFGKKFFKDEFGIDSKILWLPDVFGYNAALPQILKKAGVDKFVTSKISWNEYNKMPYDLFMWRGIDGTEILTYFMTATKGGPYWLCEWATSYTADLTPAFAINTWKRFQQSEYANETFITYGYGDGGGGPTAEMIETGTRIERGILGVPKTQMSTASKALESIRQKFETTAKQLGHLPKWAGELYLEFHRGTYTTVGRVKRYNRKTEIMCQNSERLSVLDTVLNNAEYPQKDISSAWKTVILNQFHDVIPGSSINAVYDDAFKMYESAQKKLNSVIDNAILNISENVNADKGYLIFNNNGFSATQVAKIGDRYVTCKNVPANGWCIVNGEPEKSSVTVGEKVIENHLYRVEFDDDYDIISIFDKINKREVVIKGKKANEFIMYEDMPYMYDAWDISHYHKYKRYKIDEICSVKAVDEGARAGFEVVKRFKKSLITQRVYLYNNVPRIDFETRVDWHQKKVIFKTAFPVDVNTNKATYDIQFGNVERTHTENTSWDIAKFETCAHKWADISDGGYGMALINDCKYGYSVVDGSTIQLSLLRGANSFFDEENDQGEHTFAYSIIPHKGDFKQGNVIKEAYAFNNPLIAEQVKGKKGSLPKEYSLVSTDSENIVIETIKKAENSNSLIVRLYEAYNQKGMAGIRFGLNVKKAFICDLLENEIEEVPINNNSLNLAVSNFEIVTLKIEY